MTLDERMKQAGMATIDEMLAGTELDAWLSAVEVVDMESFEWWLETKYRYFLTMQAKYQLDKKEDDEMFEWILSHSALFGSVLANFRKAKKNGN
jgi:hypothetical protein